MNACNSLPVAGTGFTRSAGRWVVPLWERCCSACGSDSCSLCRCRLIALAPQTDRLRNAGATGRRFGREHGRSSRSRPMRNDWRFLRAATTRYLSSQQDWVLGVASTAVASVALEGEHSPLPRPPPPVDPAIFTDAPSPSPRALAGSGDHGHSRRHARQQSSTVATTTSEATMPVQFQSAAAPWSNAAPCDYSAEERSSRPALLPSSVVISVHSQWQTETKVHSSI